MASFSISDPRFAAVLSEYKRQLDLEAEYPMEVLRRAESLSARLQHHERGYQHMLGLDPTSKEELEKATKEEANLIAQDYAAFLQSPRPASLIDAWRGRLISRQQRGDARHAKRFPLDEGSWAHFLAKELPPPFDAQLTPPAIDCQGTCNALLGDMNVSVSDTGGGGMWGWGAAPERAPSTAALTFVFVPPYSGDLYITARLDLSGTVYLVAHDHWYTVTHARAKLSLGVRLYQQYLDSGQPLVVFDEHRTDTSAAYWVVDSFYPTASTTITGGSPVLITIWVSLYGSAQSDHATVECDFSTGADKHIRVPSVDVHLSPF